MQGCLGPGEPERGPWDVEGPEDPGVKSIIGVCERRGAWPEGQGPDGVGTGSWAGPFLVPPHRQCPDPLTRMSKVQGPSPVLHLHPVLFPALGPSVPHC